MNSQKPKLIVIVGPTASGKSELAVKLARKIGGEVISADSRQIYRGLDIGTGKVPGKWVCKNSANTRAWRSICWFSYKGISHHCIDFASPKRVFTVAEYKKCADTAIRYISGRGKIPIIAGGTGFWIDAVVYNLNIPEVPPNQKLRKELRKKKADELLNILQKLDPHRAKTIEPKNPRRLIRAIEIAKAIGKVPKLKKHSLYKVHWIGLRPDNLEKRITRRIRAMLRKGLIKEVKRLSRHRTSKKRIHEFGFEYRLAQDFLDKKISARALEEKLVKESLKYARRQMTWFKINIKIRWIKGDKKANLAFLRSR